METLIETRLRKQLESLKKFQQLNAPRNFSYFGYLGELFLGVIILGQLLLTRGTEILSIAGIPHLLDWILFAIAFVLIFHALYLVFRFHADKRLRKILEGILSDTGKESESQKE